MDKDNKTDFGSEYMLMSPEGWIEHIKDLWHGLKDSGDDKGMAGLVGAAVDDGRVAKIEMKAVGKAIVIEIVIKGK